MKEIEIKNIDEIWPKDVGSDCSFLALTYDSKSKSYKWGYYMTDEYRRWQKGPYNLNEEPEYDCDKKDIEECKNLLKNQLKNIANLIMLNFENIEKKYNLEFITVKLLIESIATKINHEGETTVYQRPDGVKIYLLPSYREERWLKRDG